MSGILFYKNDSIGYCLNASQIYCASQAYFYFFNNDVKKFCINKCPLECTRMVYSVSTSSASFPAYSYYQFLKEQSVVLKHFNNNASALTYELLKSKILSVNINYEDLSFTRITEDPKMEIMDLIGSTGGTLGILNKNKSLLISLFKIFFYCQRTVFGYLLYNNK
jgi:hypothetical protein